MPTNMIVSDDQYKISFRLQHPSAFRESFTHLAKILSNNVPVKDLLTELKLTLVCCLNAGVSRVTVLSFRYSSTN